MTLRLKPWWLFVGGVAMLAVAGTLVWSARIQAMDREIARKRKTLKTLHVGERVPPTPEVSRYFSARTEALERRYQAALAHLTVSGVAEMVEHHADPQLFFQQRLYETQGLLERLTRARGMTMPDRLGLPKELPPTEAVPRFLIQVDLMKEAAERLIALQGVSQVVSFKFDDPQLIDTGAEGDDARFLTKLQVRVRLRCSLDALAKLLNAMDQATPMIDVQQLRVVTLEASQELDVECVLARYLVTEMADLPVTHEPSKPARSRASHGS